MGKGRTTTGMILACLLKDMLFGDPNIKYYKDDKVTTEEFPDEDEYQMPPDIIDDKKPIYRPAITIT